MSRRRKDPGILDMAFEILEFIFKIVPPWTSIPAAVVGYFTIVWWASNKVTNPTLAPATKQLGFVLGIIFVILCLSAGFKGWQLRRERQRFMAQEIDLDWVKQLNWQDFEKQVAAVYEKNGYCVEHTGGGGADGGIDLKLVKNGKSTVVQCKHWNRSKVGVKPIREIFGVMTAERADAAIFIASGSYTSEAQRFAEGKPIQLIGRDQFIELVRQFQGALRVRHSYSEKEANPRLRSVTTAPQIPSCPNCSRSMVLRRAGTGKHVGKEFWGCPAFPRCRGTREIS